MAAARAGATPGVRPPAFAVSIGASADAYAGLGTGAFIDVYSDVAIEPASTMVTRTPKTAVSRASASEKPSNANFAVTYGPRPAAGASRPLTDESCTTCPAPCVRDTGNAARHTWIAPHRFVSSWSRKSAGGVSSKLDTLAYPALFTTPSSPPNSSTATCTASRADRGSRASRATVRTVSGYVEAKSATAPADRAVATTRWPASSAATASARPSPREVPVINSVLTSAVLK
nr:hypothetical protein [Amycolatopsis sp. FDAARGOS 1241]